MKANHFKNMIPEVKAEYNQMIQRCIDREESDGIDFEQMGEDNPETGCAYALGSFAILAAFIVGSILFLI